jgi:hypothetical protein
MDSYCQPSVGWFFYDRMSGAAAIGRLLPIGWDFNLFYTTGSLGPGSLAEWTHIVADGDTLFFYNRSNGSAAIGTVSSIGLTTNLSFAPGSFGNWTHVVNYGSVLLFYNRDNGAGAVGSLSPKSFVTNLTYNPGSFGPWTHVITDGATVLFYNRDYGSGAIGTLAAGGYSGSTIYQAGQFSRWSHVTGDSACGPEELELKTAVLLCHWHRPPSITTVFPVDYYRHYVHDLSYEGGIGRYWFDQSGGQLRLTGHVQDWIPLSVAPSNPTIANNRQALAQQAITDAQNAGWHARDAQAIIIFVAADQAQGINAGALGSPLFVDGANRWVAVLLADSTNYVAATGSVADFRFDFNCHEVGHLVGGVFSFGHAYGPKGPYDNPYCIMSAMSYRYLGQGVTYDRWTPGSANPPEELTRGPGLSGSTRAGCGWARALQLQSASLTSGVDVYLAQLDDHASTLPQVVVCPATIGGTSATYTFEIRSPLAERDQDVPPAIVLCQREGSPWSSDTFWKTYSSTFIADRTLASDGSLPSITQPGVAKLDVLEIGPAQTIGGRTGIAWVKVRLSKA